MGKISKKLLNLGSINQKRKKLTPLRQQGTSDSAKPLGPLLGAAPAGLGADRNRSTLSNVPCVPDGRGPIVNVTLVCLSPLRFKATSSRTSSILEFSIIKWCHVSDDDVRGVVNTSSLHLWFRRFLVAFTASGATFLNVQTEVSCRDQPRLTEWAMNHQPCHCGLPSILILLWRHYYRPV